MNIKSLLFENRSIKQTILKNTFWLMLSEGISKGLIFFLTVWIARYLGTEGFGVFSFVFAFVALFAILADFGLSTLTIREVAKDKSLVRKYIDNITIIKLILGLITFGLILIIVQFLGKTPEVKTLVYLAGICIIIQSFTQFFQSIFRAFEKMQYEALSKIIYSLLLFSIAGFILWQNLGIKLLLSSYIIAALLALIFTVILVRKKFTRFWGKIDFGFWKRLSKETYPLFLAGVSISLYSYIDIFMLSLMKDDTAVGLYSASCKIVTFFLMLAGILMATIFPIISKQFILSAKVFKNIINKLIQFMTIIGLPLSIGGTLFGTKIINVFYGENYNNAILSFQILSWLIFITYITLPYINALIASNKQKVYMLGTGLATLVNIILNALLIPKYSLNGAAIAIILAALILLAFVSFHTKKFMNTFMNTRNNFTKI